jgi:hypothetical protein
MQCACVTTDDLLVNMVCGELLQAGWDYGVQEVKSPGLLVGSVLVSHLARGNERGILAATGRIVSTNLRFSAVSVF